MWLRACAFVDLSNLTYTPPAELTCRDYSDDSTSPEKTRFGDTPTVSPEKVVPRSATAGNASARTGQGVDF